MMHFHSLIVIFLVLGALTTIPFVRGGKNPCHSDKYEQGRRVTCEGVKVPWLLCGSCRLKEPLNNGNFKNCKSIYDITSDSCKKQLRIYANLNKNCDPVRYEQVKDFSKSKNVEGLDYFIYSVCEQCCDCIPKGSKIEDYDNRKQSGNLLFANRGNCPAHAHYDICQVWPNVKYVIRPDGNFPPTTGNSDLSKLPKVCPILQNWVNRGSNRDWVLKSWLWVDEPLLNFFYSFFKVVNCSQVDVWKSCTDLEEKQGRL